MKCLILKRDIDSQICKNMYCNIQRVDSYPWYAVYTLIAFHAELFITCK